MNRSTRPLIAACLVLGSISCEPESVSKGQPMGAGPVHPVAVVLDSPADHSDRRITIEGHVAEVCPTVGCWIHLDGPRSGLRVELLGFTVDRSLVGESVRLNGRLVERDGVYRFLARGVFFSR